VRVWDASAIVPWGVVETTTRAVQTLAPSHDGMLVWSATSVSSAPRRLLAWNAKAPSMSPRRERRSSALTQLAVGDSAGLAR
jgi:hypothetical protein